MAPQKVFGRCQGGSERFEGFKGASKAFSGIAMAFRNAPGSVSESSREFQ